MDRLKTLGMYASWVIIFYFFSNILIFVGLNANYEKLNSDKAEVPSQVNIEQAEATAVNGRIRGSITNDGDEDLNGKYMQTDLYSKNDVLLGSEFTAINDLNKGDKTDFDLNFKAQNVDHYKISFVDKLKEVNNDLFNVKFLKRPLSSTEVVGLLILLALLG